MLGYILRRILMMIPTLLVISILSFIIIQLPPGDFLTTYAAQLSEMGDAMDQQALEALGERYGLGQPVYVQYYKWMSGIFLRGDWGQSMEWHKPVKELIWERLGLTVMLSLVSLLVSWFVAIPVGVYSATHQYSKGDYFFTTIGFIGLAIPSFMLALILLFIGLKVFNTNLTGLFSPEYLDAPWSLDKVIDLIKHLPIPVIVVGMAGTAGLIRVMRATLLDELEKQYVITARAKGVSETKMLFKYPVRVALNPLISNLAWLFPALVSGGAIVAIVLGLPTAGPMLLRSLLTQDTFLTASILLFMTVLTVVGTTVSDILLVMVDPRIRMEKRSS
jgi:peptide/nickel transport system permease protein